MNRRVGYSRDMNVYGRVWSIYVMKEELNVLSIIATISHSCCF
ncbi:MAG: hypothetical protein ACLVLH_20890 [Eisenbergiella massiliensis]